MDEKINNYNLNMIKDVDSIGPMRRFEEIEKPYAISGLK